MTVALPKSQKPSFGDTFRLTFPVYQPVCSPRYLSRTKFLFRAFISVFVTFIAGNRLKLSSSSKFSFPYSSKFSFPYSNHLCKVQICVFFFFLQDEFDIHSKKFDIDGAYIPRVMFMGWYKFKFDFFLSFTPAIPNMWQRWWRLFKKNMFDAVYCLVLYEIPSRWVSRTYIDTNTPLRLVGKEIDWLIDWL